MYFDSQILICHGYLTHDLLHVVKKYELCSHVSELMKTGYFPDKVEWARTVNRKLSETEQYKWQIALSEAPQMSRYASVHSALAPHRLWGMCELYPISTKCVHSLVKLSVLPIVGGICLLCDTDNDYIVKHQLLECSRQVIQRAIHCMKK